MKLASEFLKLPLRFDADRLREEALGFAEDVWEYHPQGYAGNSALILVSARGELNNDYTGPMAATAALERCPYIRQVLASFDTVIGRSRLMRLDPGCEVPPHSDTHYSWKHRVRIHIPVVTDPAVTFSSIGNRDVHMQAGEAWIFDNWKKHAVRNESTVRRIHLVIDTTGTAKFWDLVSRSWQPDSDDSEWLATVRFVQPEEQPRVSLKFERHNSMPVLPPAEIDQMSQDFLSEVTATDTDPPESLCALFASFRQDWRSTWSLYADSQDGMAHYRSLAHNLLREARKVLGSQKLPANGSVASEVLTQWLDATVDSTAPGRTAAPGVADTSLFDSPVFIVAAPRSGSTMLFEILQQNMELWTIGDESHVEIESIRQLHPASHNFDSNALDADDATPAVSAKLVGTFVRKLQNSQGNVYTQMPATTQASSVRFLEKTPKNALRIPFIQKLFPDALFIYLHRSPAQNIGSIMDAWTSGNFVTYPKLPGWRGLPWSLLLPRGWRDLAGKPLEQIAAHQWREANATILHDLAQIPDRQYCCVSYEDLVADTETQLRRICEFADIPFGPRMQAISRDGAPLSKYTLSRPDPEKWRRYEAEIESVLPELTGIQHELTQFVSH